MVLRGNHRHDGLAVREGKHRDLRSGQEFLDDDPASGIAEFLFFHHGADRCFRVLPGLRDDDAFTQRQAVRFDDGRDRRFVQIGERFVHLGERLILSGRNVVFSHQILGEHLARFDDRRVFHRAEAFDSERFQPVNASHGQRIVRSDHGKIHRMALDEFHDPVDVRGPDIHAVRICRDTAVARQGVDRLNVFVLFQFLDDRMLTAAAANN